MLFCRALFVRRSLTALVHGSVRLGHLGALCRRASGICLPVGNPSCNAIPSFSWPVYAVRSVAILNSASTLFSWPGGDPVSADEILRAVLFVDVALVAKTCAQILAAHRTAGHGESQIHFANAAAGDITHQRVAAFAIVVGAIALLLWSKIPGLDA